MPKRTDISSILVIGAGPIIIGQACEFDYSGTQAIKALKEEGYRVILVNSNPATIMTDPDMADATYVEPITPEIVARIIEKERPDAVLPTMGGQTALNTALALFNDGTLEKYGVKMIGADADAIDKAENRQRFREAMDKIGLESARSGVANTVAQAFEILERTGLPSIIRPSFTLGGTGGGIRRVDRRLLGELLERLVPPEPAGAAVAGPRGRPARAMQADMPPSAGMTAPLTMRDSSDARNTAAPARSDGSPHLPAGMRARMSRLRVSSARRASVLFVSIYPGAMAFTFMPLAAHSFQTLISLKD